MLPGSDSFPEDQQQPFADLQRVLHRLWIDRLEAESRQLIASSTSGSEAGVGRESLERLRSVHLRIAEHKAALRADASAAPAGTSGTPGTAG